MIIPYLASLDLRRSLLWSALLWYVVMAVRYAGHDPGLWLHAVGLAAIVGVILTLNAVSPDGHIRSLGFWSVFRLFLIPFCVASFSAFAKGRAFFPIFPLNLAENMVAVGILAVFGGGVWVAKSFSPHMLRPAPNLSFHENHHVHVAPPVQSCRRFGGVPLCFWPFCRAGGDSAGG